MLQLFYDVRDAARRTEQPRIWRSAGVSICTFVLVKQVNRVSAYMAPQRHRCQYLYFCTSKASKLITRISGGAGGRGRRVRAAQFTCFTGTKVLILTPVALWRHIRDCGAVAPYTGTNVQMLTLEVLQLAHVARDCEVLLEYIYMIYIYRPRIRGRVAGGRGRRVRACGEGV
jgi:hypothetical protein